MTHAGQSKSKTTSTNQGRNPVDVLADEFVDRLRRGEFPTVNEYANRYPELAEEIFEVLPTLEMLEKCGDDELGTGAGLSKSDDTPDQLGEYQIIREIARGGMGVVYEAEHDTLGRRVALKVLPAQMAQRGAHLQRFYRESRAAGRLHHTNIVPVFDVGTDRGYHFYAMQFIQGQSLDVVIDELQRLQNESSGKTAGTAHGSRLESLSRSVAMSLKSGDFQAPSSCGVNWCDETIAGPFQTGNETNKSLSNSPAASTESVSESFHSGKPLMDSAESTNSTSARYSYYHRVARIGMQVSEALAHAHGLRVLHRDIKPSNIILDTAGVSWITDFGLAKNEDADLTATGDIVGTFRYMAPERFKGEADARSDVYGLGLTLYELCTLRSAFTETDRVRLINVITTQDPPRPRRINPLVPRDLETIILKAIDRQASRRYGSAKALASDLSLFLSDRPISARRSSVIEQTWRLCRRNPLPSVLCACTLALLALIVAGALRFGYYSQQKADQLRTENIRALAAEQDALDANKLATEHLYELSVGRAESGRFSGRIGQNFATIESIVQAVSLLPQLGISDDQRHTEKQKLRNLAIAAMSLVDLRGERESDIGPSLALTLDAEHQTLAQGDGKGNISIRRIDGEQPELTFTSPGSPARWIRFSDDRSYLLSKHHDGDPNAGLLAVWDVRRGQLGFQLKDDLRRSTAAISPNCDQVAVGRKRGAIDILSLADGLLKASIPTGVDPTHIVFDATGARLAFASGRKIQIWSLGSESPDTELEMEATVTQLAWNSTHAILAAGSDAGHLLVWHDNEFQLPPWVLESHRGSAVVRLAIHPDGELLVSGGWDDFVRVNDLTTQEQVLRIDRGQLMQCGFSRDGSGIAYTRKRKVGIWRLPSRPLTVLRSNSDDWRGDSFFHPTDRRLLVSPVNSAVELWDVERRKVIATISSRHASCRFTPDGAAILTADRSSVRRWSIEITDNSRGEMQVTVGDASVVYEGAAKRFCVDGSGRFMALVRHSRDIITIDMENGNAVQRIGLHNDLDRIAITPTGRFVFTSTWQGWAVRVWDRESGELVKTLVPFWRSTSLNVSPDGQRLFTVSGQKLVAWNTQTLDRVWEHDRNNPANWPGPIASSNGGRYVACCASRYVPQLCDSKTGTSIAILEAPMTEEVGEFSFSVDDELLAIRNTSNIHVWDLDELHRRLAELGLSWEDTR